jgi:hypothetical protein
MNKSMTLRCIFGNKIVNMEASPIEGEARWLLTFPYNLQLIAEVKAMQGAKWDPASKTWSVDSCMRNTFAFAALTGSQRYKRFRSDSSIDVTEYFLKEVIAGKYTVPTGGMNITDKFWKHQKRIYSAIRVKRRCIIAAVPRSGKSLPTLAAFMHSECHVCWWVTTKNAKLGVQRELRKWYPLAERTVTFMSYDAFSTIMDEYKDNIVANPPQFIVFDECHKLKTPDTQRSMAALLLSEIVEGVFKDLEYVVCLSGTPAPKDPSDWWTQCEVARSGYLREGSIKKFKNRYGKWAPYDPDVPVWERFKGWDKIELSALAKRMAGLVYIFLQEDCLDLPPLRYERVFLQPGAELLRVAKMLTDTCDNPLTARIRLRQLSDGFQYDRVYIEETNSETQRVEYLGSPKLERLKSDLEEYEDLGRICIYAGFYGSLDIIKQTCLAMGWDVLQIDGRVVMYHYAKEQTLPCKEGESTQMTVVSSNAESVIMMALGEMDRSTDTHTIGKLAVVAHPLSGGAGNEFSSAPVSIYYSNPDSGEARMQSEERGHSGNMDMDRGHTIIDYLLLPTDTLILDKLQEKKELQAISMGELQRAIETYGNIVSDPLISIESEDSSVCIPGL